MTASSPRDSGTTASWYGQHVRFRPGMMGSLSGNLATMGPGVPYAIAAKFAFPVRGHRLLRRRRDADERHRRVDHGREVLEGVDDPRLVVCVLNNHDLNMVTWEERVMAGDKKFEASQDVPEFNYAEFAESIGLRGIRVEDPERVGAAWDEALSADRPCILDFRTDPDPAAAAAHYIRAGEELRTSLLHDPSRSAIIRDAMRQLMDTFTK